MPRALRHPPAQNTLALTLPALLAWAAVSLPLVLAVGACFVLIGPGIASEADVAAYFAAWRVFDRKGRCLYCSPSRETCLAWERQYLDWVLDHNQLRRTN